MRLSNLSGGGPVPPTLRTIRPAMRSTRNAKSLAVRKDDEAQMRGGVVAEAKTTPRRSGRRR
jgi:hypothetical protein